MTHQSLHTKKEIARTNDVQQHKSTSYESALKSLDKTTQLLPKHSIEGNSIQLLGSNPIQMKELQRFRENTSNGYTPKHINPVQAFGLRDTPKQETPIKHWTPEVFQRQQKENKTGLPDNLKSGVENLSGMSMDDVKVHYNSSKPSQLQAHAYAQGTDIHVASGQEKHLPHEAWHVAQQKQGRVKPTTQVQGVNVNDDTGLEREADVMGGKAMQMKANNPIALNEEITPTIVHQLASSGVVQLSLQDTVITVAKYLGITASVAAIAAYFMLPTGLVSGILLSVGMLGMNAPNIVNYLQGKKQPDSSKELDIANISSEEIESRKETERLAREGIIIEDIEDELEEPASPLALTDVSWEDYQKREKAKTQAREQEVKNQLVAQWKVVDEKVWSLHKEAENLNKTFPTDDLQDAYWNYLPNILSKSDHRVYLEKDNIEHLLVALDATATKNKALYQEECNIRQRMNTFNEQLKTVYKTARKTKPFQLSYVKNGPSKFENIKAISKKLKAKIGTEEDPKSEFAKMIGSKVFLANSINLSKLKLTKFERQLTELARLIEVFNLEKTREQQYVLIDEKVNGDAKLFRVTAGELKQKARSEAWDKTTLETKLDEALKKQYNISVDKWFPYLNYTKNNRLYIHDLNDIHGKSTHMTLFADSVPARLNARPYQHKVDVSKTKDDIVDELFDKNNGTSNPHATLEAFGKYDSANNPHYYRGGTERQNSYNDEANGKSWATIKPLLKKELDDEITRVEGKVDTARANKSL